MDQKFSSNLASRIIQKFILFVGRFDGLFVINWLEKEQPTMENNFGGNKAQADYLPK